MTSKHKKEPTYERDESKEDEASIEREFVVEFGGHPASVVDIRLDEEDS